MKTSKIKMNKLRGIIIGRKETLNPENNLV